MNGLIPGTGSGSGAKNSGKEGLGTRKDEKDAQNDINMVNDAKNPIPVLNISFFYRNYIQNY